MQAVILAAGSGKRLRPLTNNRSKAMIPVAGVPIVGRVIDGIIAAGITDLIVVIRPDDKKIRDFLTERYSRNASVQTVVQQRPLGMGDALRQASRRIHEDFLLSACDNLIEQEDLERFIACYRHESDIAGLLSLIPVAPERIRQTAIVEMQGDRVTGIVEKPDPANVTSRIASAPLYIFSTRIMSHLDNLTESTRGEYELQEAISKLIFAGADVRGYYLSGRQTLTSEEDLLALTIHHLKDADRKGNLPQPPDLPGVEVKPPVLIEPGACIDPGCVIGPYVYVEAGVHVRAGNHVRNGYLLRQD